MTTHGLSPAMLQALRDGWARTNQTAGAMLARGLLTERPRFDHETGGFPLALSEDGRLIRDYLRRIRGHCEARWRHEAAAEAADDARADWLVHKASAHWSIVAHGGRLPSAHARDLLAAFLRYREAQS